jgi:hypothetical protein
MTVEVLPHGDSDEPTSRRDGEVSLHYVDTSGEPVNVRRWYKNWVITFAVISIIAGYNVFADGHRRSFAVGASAGISAVAACLTVAYGYAWWSDCRRELEPRQYWVQRNVRNAKATVRIAGPVLLGLAVGLISFLDSGREFLAGLSVGPAIATAALLAIGSEVRQKQHAKGLG